ncbi:hypothetical protein ACOI1C_05075 [Bacillus sp. DJP31]|uniref:hypothetical protein n=1 Tax=Bacillus sp. DJP31 TaxID=3409789 RepID=UPI003BB77871
MKNNFVIHNISDDDNWNKVFNICLNEANRFEVAYPLGDDEDDNPLLVGRDYFSSTPSLKTKPWDLMDNSLLYYGELNTAIKNYIYTKVSPSFDGEKSEIWNFSLFKNDIKLLSVTDFNVCIIYHGQFMERLLIQNGITIDE